MIGAVRMLKKGLYSFKEIADILDYTLRIMSRIVEEIVEKEVAAAKREDVINLLVP